MQDDAPNPSRPPDFTGGPPSGIQKTRARFRLPIILMLSGVLALVLGMAPLLLTILFAWLGWTSDPNPNPVGFGMLAMCTFWPSIALVVGGAALAIARR